jgi:hypothetical protein
MILSTVLTDLIIVVVVSAFACFTSTFFVIDYNNTEKIFFIFKKALKEYYIILYNGK